VFIVSVMEAWPFRFITTSGLCLAAIRTEARVCRPAWMP
jgi:hypothetical protein